MPADRLYERRRIDRILDVSLSASLSLPSSSLANDASLSPDDEYSLSSSESELESLLSVSVSDPCGFFLATIQKFEKKRPKINKFSASIFIQEKRIAKIHLCCHFYRCPFVSRFPFPHQNRLNHPNKRHAVLLFVREDFDGLCRWIQSMSCDYVCASGLVISLLRWLYHHQRKHDSVLGTVFPPNARKQT